MIFRSFRLYLYPVILSVYVILSIFVILGAYVILSIFVILSAAKDLYQDSSLSFRMTLKNQKDTEKSEWH